MRLVALLAAGCQANPDWANQYALRAGAPLADAVAIRERQTMRFSVADERAVLREATDTLQDLGYTIEESAPEVGVLAGSKDRDATEAGQVAGQVALTIALALLGARYQPVWDKDQIIRVTLTTQPDARDTRMRVSFERIIINSQGVARSETLTQTEFGAGFFALVRNGLVTKGLVQ